MLRDILKVLAYFNWITPLEIVAHRAVDGPAYSFKIPESAGRSGAEIVNMLRQQGGILTHGHMVVNDHIIFHVRREQASFAQYLLQRAGIPIMNPIQTTHSGHGGHVKREAHNAPKQDLMDRLDRFMDDIWHNLGLF